MDKLEMLEQENVRLNDEIKKLNLQNKKLSRELRMTNSLLDKATKSFEAKDHFATAMAAASTRQKAYTDVLLEHCPNIIVLLDTDGSFVLSTAALMTAMNIPNFGFVKNMNYVEVFSKYLQHDDMENFKEMVGHLSESGEYAHFEAWIDFAQNGEPLFYSVVLRRVGGGAGGIDGIKSGILIVMVDLTDFMEEKRRAEAANNAKSDFLAIMSHEIRTPMNVIVGMTTVLERLGLSEEHQNYLSNIQKASDSLLSIINDILDFSKIEAAKMEIVAAGFSLRSMLDNIYSMFSVISKQKGLELSLVIDPSLPENIHGDENRIRQILVNLLSNAIKFTKRGGVCISAHLDKDRNLQFGVIDSGTGIRPEDIDRLFMPFEQLETRKNHNVVGTGLGLAISYNLCRVMGGDITVSSVYGSGSTFTVKLPYVSASNVVEVRRSDVSEFMAPTAHVLVVDDVDTNLFVAEAILDFFGIKPDLADGGAKAVRLANMKAYDLIFMDHMMPEIDGIEATRRIKTDSELNRNTPIVALTANAIKGTDIMFLSNGLDDVLAKPIQLDTLNRCLRKWLPEEKIEV